MIFRALFLQTTRLLSCDSLTVEVILCFPRQFAVVAHHFPFFYKGRSLAECLVHSNCSRLHLIFCIPILSLSQFSHFLDCHVASISIRPLFQCGPTGLWFSRWLWWQRGQCVERRFSLLPFRERWNAMVCRRIWRSIGLLGREGKVQPKAFIGLCVRKEEREVGTA